MLSKTIESIANSILNISSNYLARQVFAILPFIIFMAFFFVAQKNPDVFELDKELVSYLNKFINLAFLSLIPFTLGMLGSSVKILLSDSTNTLDNIKISISSGIMAIFSWIGIKSGILLSIIAPHLEKQNINVAVTPPDDPRSFYTLAIIAVLVGMFSSNFYIFMLNKVEQATSTRRSRAYRR
ncbi:hypothetical protein [uncultured Pseudomonas sp.]|uniref:hypothetical protein n=1 Tax=uncultured Pseudomonas sp. TaxID=114707 RepID=UPI002588AFE5|nr:hypothetical protein [uncultured Pseudomonas sp.]